MNYYIRVRNEEQLQQAADILKGRRDVTFMIPVDMEADAIKSVKAFDLAADLPFVARENIMRKLVSCVEAANWAKAMVVKNIDELGLLESIKYQGRVIADSFLYAANYQAMEMYREHFPEMTFMASDELTDDETFKMKDSEKFIYKIYGRARLMITAQSLKDNFISEKRDAQNAAKGRQELLKGQKAGEKVDAGEDDRSETVMIESLKHDRFISADESFGYSILYTKDPVSMLDKMDEIRCENVLVDFTFEGAKEVKAVIEALLSGGELKDVRTGRGHHYKGID